ncbi:MAG: trypsin-like peptidase domain-containing protein [Bacteroidales bacterium]
MKIKTLTILFSILSIITYGQSVSDMLEKSLGAVVTVGVYKTSFAKQSLGFRGESAPDIAYEKALSLAEVSSAGSGFVIEKNGKFYVVTNAHVIESASDEEGSIYVYSISREKYEMILIGGDSFYDIAVLEFVTNPGEEISTVSFRKTDVRIGEKVYAIGNPLGEYPYTVTDGIISAKNRVRGGMTGKFGFLQSTATLIWGNSGGPLIDEMGTVVGVNSQIAFADSPDGSQILQSQINFALEASLSERLVNDIIENDGRVKRAFLGIELSQKYGWDYTTNYDYIQVNIDEMPIISGVIPGSPAFSVLGTKIGHEVVKINGVEIRNLEEALGELEKIKPGSSVYITTRMDGYSTDINLKASELKTTELEHIAKYVLDQNKDILVNYDHPQVSFTMRASNFYQHDGDEIKKFEMSRGASSKYYILAAGIVSDQGQSMWIINDLKDMGAALRLSGMSGLIDFYVLGEGYSVDDIELLRQYLSGDESVTKSALWY